MDPLQYIDKYANASGLVHISGGAGCQSALHGPGIGVGGQHYDLGLRYLGDQARQFLRATTVAQHDLENADVRSESACGGPQSDVRIHCGQYVVAKLGEYRHQSVEKHGLVVGDN